MDIDASIASPHWEACETCKHNGNNGCCLSYIDLELHELGDWILCMQYENNQSLNLTDAS